MEARDIDAVHRIETASFSIPWSRDAFLTEVTQNACARYLVLALDGEPAAYAGTWFVLDEAHITNIAVRPDVRGRGLGELITRALIQLAADSGMTWMTLECRKGNLTAQGLYRKLGFIDVGLRKRYYADTGEDALVMALEELPPGNPENDPRLVREG
jgi:ribosomal-protein-alanine N-acetyltransferase